MEANNIFVAYDTTGKSEDASETFVEAIRLLGSAVSVLPMVWLVKSDMSCDEAYDALRGVVDAPTRFLVVDASHDRFRAWPDGIPVFPEPTA